MNFFASIGIGKRLYVLSSLLVVALGLVTALAWSKLSHVNLEMENVASDLVPQQQRLALIELNVTRSSLQVRHALQARCVAACLALGLLLLQCGDQIHRGVKPHA